MLTIIRLYNHETRQYELRAGKCFNIGNIGLIAVRSLYNHGKISIYHRISGVLINGFFDTVDGAISATTALLKEDTKQDFYRDVRDELERLGYED